VWDSEDDSDPHSGDILQHYFLRKYTHFTKTRIKPVLTETMCDFIANQIEWARQDEWTLSITAHSLEAVSCHSIGDGSHHVSAFSETVEAEPDCENAMNILSFVPYHESSHSLPIVA